MKNSTFGSLRAGEAPEGRAGLLYEIILPPEPPALLSFFGLFEASSKVISPPTGTARSDFGSSAATKGFVRFLWCDGNNRSSLLCAAGETIVYGLCTLAKAETFFSDSYIF